MPRYSRFGGWVEKDGEWVKAAGTPSAVSGNTNEKFYKLIKLWINENAKGTCNIVFIGDENDYKKYQFLNLYYDDEGNEGPDACSVSIWPRYNPGDNLQLYRYELGEQIKIGEYKNSDDLIKTVKEIIQNKQIINIVDNDDEPITEDKILKQHKFHFGKRRSPKGKANTVNADIAYLQSI
jgi:hypothetical protein